MLPARNADLISADRLPHNALRRGELYLKRQMLRVETAAVVRQQALYAQAYRDLLGLALDLADRFGLSKLGSSRASMVWRNMFMTYALPRIRQLAEDVWRDTVRATGAALTGAYYGRLWLLDMATRVDVNIHVPMLRGADVLAPLTEDIFSDLIQSLVSRQWRDQTNVEMDDLTVQVRRSVGQGMVGGESVPTAMQRVRGRMNATFNRVQTMTRTVVNQVSNAATKAAYGANRDKLDGYEWLTARDERVCPQCAALDGKKFSFDGSQQPPPLHWNCRCTLVPLVKPNLLTSAKDALRTAFDAWTQALGSDSALHDFLNPTSI